MDAQSQLDNAGAAPIAPPAPSGAEDRLIELVGYLVQGVVTRPQDVEVEEFYDQTGTVYGVRVHADDIGRIIGREGRVANALRHVVKAAALKAGTHVTVEILTEEDLEGLGATIAGDTPQ